MARGELTADQLQEVGARIPDLSRLRQLIVPLSPDLISWAFGPESDVPVAAVCLQDAYHILEDVVYAMHEYHAHHIYYRVLSDPPMDLEAAHFERYYLDDAALRLYSAAEHLANAVLAILDVAPGDLKRFKKRSGRRFAGRMPLVRAYLESDHAGSPLSVCLSTLGDLEAWRSVVIYRNEWVHNQPPTIDGLGLVYHRKRRWEKLPHGKGLRVTLGGGDQPRYAISCVFDFVNEGVNGFLAAFEVSAGFYLEVLKTRNIHVSWEDGKSKVSFGA